VKSCFKFVVGLACALATAASVCRGQSVSFTSQATADAFVTTGANGSLSSSNFGGAGSLAISASGQPQGEFQSVLKFDLSGAKNSFDAQFGAGQWMIESITLSLTASPHGNPIFNNPAAGQFGVSLMQNNSWIEGTGTGGIPTSDGISFDSLQGVYIDPLNDQALGTFSFGGGTSGLNNYTLSLSSGLASDALAGDDVSLRLFAADSDIIYLFNSRTGSGAASSHPEITVRVEPVPEPRSVALCAAALVTLWLVQCFRRWVRRNQ
jgi:hypothetical protein